MKITRYRMGSFIYPWKSLECEVTDGDKKYYVNISVNNEGKQEELHEDGHWCYNKPMDQIGFDEHGNQIDYEKDYEESLCDVKLDDVLKQMLDFWNSNPVLGNDESWKDWEEHC